VRAVVKDKAELAVLPGPGRTIRAVMDRFPALGPAMNRAAGAEKTMQLVADHREQQARLIAAPAAPLCSKTERLGANNDSSLEHPSSDLVVSVVPWAIAPRPLWR